MKTYRITYKNTDLINSNVDRLKKDLKNLYWEEGKAPKNWNQFDDEIDFDGQQSRGGDCIEITFAETMSESWINSIIKDLNRKRDIRFIELKKSNFEYQEVC